jgi:diacylglycerol kinase family enzyme
VSLIPSALDEGFRCLAFIGAAGVDERLAEKIRSRLEDTLREAGATDAMYTVHVKKKQGEKKLLESAANATVDGIFEAGGVSYIEE